MKKILLFLLLLIPIKSWAIDAPVLIQSSGVFAPNTTDAHTTFDSNTITVGVGHWVRATMYACTQFSCSGTFAAQQPNSVVGTAANTYFPCGLTTGTHMGQLGSWFAYFPSGSSEKVTFSDFNGGANLYANYALLEEFTGIDPSAVCTSAGKEMSDSTTVISVTTDGSVPSGYVVFTYCYSDGYITWDSPSVAIGSPTTEAYLLTGSSGAVTMTGTAGSTGKAFCNESALLGVTTSTGRPSNQLLMKVR